MSSTVHVDEHRLLHVQPWGRSVGTATPTTIALLGNALERLAFHQYTWKIEKTGKESYGRKELFLFLFFPAQNG